MNLALHRYMPKWRILLHAIRNAMTVLGIAGTVGYFAGSRIFADFLGAMIVGAAITSAYFIETFWREIRLRKGWYV